MKRACAMRVIIAIDVECRGDDMRKNGIGSIGVCVGKADTLEVLDKKRFDLRPMEYVTRKNNSFVVKTQDFEERCVQQFWSKQGDKLMRMQENAVDPMVGIRQFREFIDKYDDGTTYEANICGDNTGYDFSMINYYLSHASLKPLWRGGKSQYRSSHDTDSYSRGVMGMDYSNPWVSDDTLIKKFDLKANQANHDHMPENDAEYIYRFHIELVHKLQ